VTPGGHTFQAPPPSQVFGAQSLPTAVGLTGATASWLQRRRPPYPVTRGQRAGTTRLGPSAFACVSGLRRTTAPRPAPHDADQTPLELGQDFVILYLDMEFSQELLRFFSNLPYKGQ
jgi:hypothetical protein